MKKKNANHRHGRPEMDFQSFCMRQSQILATGCDPDARTISLFGGIVEDSAFRLKTSLDLLNESDGSITLWLSSGGGDICNGYAAYDALLASRNPVTVIGTGGIMSMATVLLQAGSKRLLTPQTRMMIHNGYNSVEVGVDTTRMYSMGKEAVQTSERMANILAKHSGCQQARIEKMMARQTFFSAQEAVDQGFADGIYTGEANE